MKFEKIRRDVLKFRLACCGWVQDQKADVTICGQMHSWYQPSNVRGVKARRYTLRNAAIAAGILAR